jgi:hypothetical protein
MSATTLYQFSGMSDSSRRIFTCCMMHPRISVKDDFYHPVGRVHLIADHLDQKPHASTLCLSHDCPSMHGHLRLGREVLRGTKYDDEE